jgi:serralysin
MMYDIAAVQHMYGANFSTNNGNTVYQWNPNTGQSFINGVAQSAPGGNRVFETIWDGGGVDTYDFSNYTSNQTINLNPGSWSVISTAQLANLGDGNTARGNVFNAFQYRGDARSLIENAMGGSGNNQMTGNAIANTLAGNSGADTIDGLLGNDTLWGGTGLDVFLFDTSLNVSTNVDRIGDFSHTADTIHLENAVFTVLRSGALSSGALANWDAADQADDRIIYRHLDSDDAGTAKDTVYLYYDRTGGSTADAVMFARLTNQASVTLDASDFRVV